MNGRGRDVLKKAMLLALLLALLGAARAEGALCVVTPQLTALTDASSRFAISAPLCLARKS